jgi:hypothetical protein
MQPASSDALDALVTFVAGDTWAGLTSVTIGTGRNSPGDLASVKMAFKLNPKAVSPTLELTSAGGDITISDAVNWVFTVDPARLPLIPGNYVWQIETEDDSATPYVETMLAGNCNVLSNYTSTT